MIPLNKGLTGAAKITVFLIILVFSFFFVYNVIPVFAKGDFKENSGAIWTTRNDCGDIKQDVNHYDIGEHVYINGANFNPGNYFWKIKGQPGGASCDPNIIVAMDIFTVNETGSFCFDAYTVQPDDCGEYKVKFANKGDNYRVKKKVNITCDNHTTEYKCEEDSNCDWCPLCEYSVRPTKVNQWLQASCVPAGTDCGWHCEIGYCDATCSLDTDCECPQDRCIGNDYYDYPDYGECVDCPTSCYCENGTASDQPCEPTIYYDDPRCGECTTDEECADDNQCTMDKCIDNYCVHTPEPLSTPCEADSNKCTLDHCDGSGSCINYDNVSIPQAEQCKSFYCDPLDGLLKENYTDFPLSTPCEADQDVCTADHCDGYGSCVFWKDYYYNLSIPNKVIEEPKIECEEGEWCDYKITVITPITLSCEVGDVKWRYALDGEWKEWNTNSSPVTIFFPEECNHTLEAYCISECGESEKDIEYFKVEGTVFEIPLYKKWNLISVPFVLLNNNPNEVFKDIKDDIISVWTYDKGIWYFWTPEDTPKNLEKIIPGWGYWVLTNNDTLLVIGGGLFSPSITPPDKEITNGWNLIGYYGTEFYGTNWEEKNLDSYDSCGFYHKYGNYAYCKLNSLIDTQKGFPRWSSLVGYDNCGNHTTYWVELNICDNMHAGKGYWIEMDVEDLYVPATVCAWNDEFDCSSLTL